MDSKALNRLNGVYAEYRHRLKRHRAALEQADRRDHALGNGRLAVFGAGLAMAGMAFGWEWFSGWWLLAPFLLFLALVVAHDRVIRDQDRGARLVDFYTRGVERLENRWAGRGERGIRYADPAHPYAEDLDLFGSGSLFERLCTARTRAGQDCLAGWLCDAASPEEVRSRQEAVKELRPRLDLREEMALLGEAAQSAMHPDALVDWGAEPAQTPSRGHRVFAFIVALVTLGTLIGWTWGAGSLPFYALLVVGQTYDALQRARVRRALRDIDRMAGDLGLLADLLRRIEREPLKAPLLCDLRAALETEGVPPSARIDRLQRYLDYLNAMRNMLFAPFGAILLWRTQFAFAIEAWRAQNGPHLGEWLRAVGEFEALSALSSYAFENPDDPFPEIEEGGVCFHAEELGHPQIPVEQVVRNDVRMDSEARLLIVSGSNMSGKSTLLRAVGVNTVLALAGAPVRARRLRLSPLHLGASIRTLDSLQAGISRFYAEILRLRQIVQIAGERPPLLFLLDEILHGTNSHDRRIGAEAVLRSLLARGAIGLVTTHDLALAQIAESPSPGAVNVHFEDQMEEGRMAFDYRLRPGVVTKSNAIALMRAVGLEVDSGE